MKTRIHIHQQTIRSNRKHGKDDPPIIIRTYKGKQYAREVLILGGSTLMYSPDKPLSCGARLWLETESVVEILR